MKRTILLVMIFAVFGLHAQKRKSILIEVENFNDKGGWVVDQQFMGIMGSPILMAHGMGIPVKDAVTKIVFPQVGKYKMFVRTRNWAARWSKADAPGKFLVLIDGKATTSVFGTESADWDWQNGGILDIKKKDCMLSLRDLTGFNGRCDAILFTRDMSFTPPADVQSIAGLRKKLNPILLESESAGKFDFVVIGGGMAGTCAAISAARLGVKVALIQDRPVLGGNNSSEVRVHLGGHINIGLYPALGNLVNEIGPSTYGNAQPTQNYEDNKKINAVNNEKNISLFLNCHANKVNMKDGRIESVQATNTITGQEILFSAPLFADCTGDANIGALAGAKFMWGRENSMEFDEKMAPKVSDSLTMGTSIQWYAEDNINDVGFPDIKWGIPWSEEKAQKITRGDWDWETGMGFNQVVEFERVRDYGLLVVYSNWSFLKNHAVDKAEFARKQLKWVAYIGGKRESRRLVGDYILRQSDLENQIVYADGTAATSWTIDLHTPDTANSKLFPGSEFKSIAEHTKIYPYPIPFRCLYSGNIPNLMMAGRNISVSHVALGTVRVMRTTGMMGEVIGMAASICKQKKTDPRCIYNTYLDDLKKLMIVGVGNPNLPKIQNYNLGATKK